MTYKWPSFSGNGFVSSVMPVLDESYDGHTSMPLYNGPKPPGGGGGGSSSSSGIYISSPSITSGTYTYYTSPTISGGTQWHGLYSGASVTVSGSGTSVTAQ